VHRSAGILGAHQLDLVSYFSLTPTVGGIGTTGSLTVGGIPGTTGPTLMNLPNGFSYTDVMLTYTFSSNDFDPIDRPIVRHITWVIQRDFSNEPAGSFINTSRLSGTELIGPVPLVTGHVVGVMMTLTTTHTNEGDASAAVALDPLFRLDATTTNATFNVTGSKFFQHPDGSESLRQDVDIEFSALSTASVGSIVRFFFRGSVDSLTDPVSVPEPSSLLLSAVGLSVFILRSSDDASCELIHHHQNPVRPPSRRSYGTRSFLATGSLHRVPFVPRSIAGARPSFA